MESPAAAVAEAPVAEGAAVAAQRRAADRSGGDHAEVLREDLDAGAEGPGAEMLEEQTASDVALARLARVVGVDKHAGVEEGPGRDRGRRPPL